MPNAVKSKRAPERTYLLNHLRILIAVLILLNVISSAQKKEIRDPAEYNAYVGAIQQSDPAGKISGLEAFLTQYPNSVMKEDALEVLMSAYQQVGNQAKMLDTAQRIVQVNPNNLRALAMLVFSKRQAAEANQSPKENLASAAQYANQGLEALKTAPKPDGMSDPDFEKLKTQVSVIFNGAAGINALQNKDYARAQANLKAAVEGDPNELRNVYALALADLTGTPPNLPEGLFFIARSANLAAGAPTQAQIEAYGKSQYVKYHGSDQGWTDLLATAKANPLPPAGFTSQQQQTVNASSPPSFDERLQSAMALYKSKQISEAMKAAAALTQADPDRWEGYGLLGAIQKDQNKVSEAKASYQRALSLAPDSIKPQIREQIEALGKP